MLEEGRTKLGQELGHYWYSVWERSPDGQLIINSNGIPRKTPFSVDTGAISPDFEASISNTFVIKVLVKAYVLDARYEKLFEGDVTEAAKKAFIDAGIYQ